MELTAKVFLTAYNDIPRMIKSLDKCIDCTINCGLGANQFYSGVTTDEMFDKIIVYKNRQDVLATVKNIVEQVLLKMKRQNAQILFAKFIKKMTFNQISLSLNVNLRTIFRYYNKALEEFVYYLRVLGYDNTEWYKGEKFLDSIEDDLKEKELGKQNKTKIKKNSEQNLIKARNNQYASLKDNFSKLKNKNIDNNKKIDIKIMQIMV